MLLCFGLSLEIASVTYPRERAGERNPGRLKSFADISKFVAAAEVAATDASAKALRKHTAARQKKRHDMADRMGSANALTSYNLRPDQGTSCDVAPRDTQLHLLRS
jgi:hypothetical protein